MTVRQGVYLSGVVLLAELVTDLFWWFLQGDRVVISLHDVLIVWWIWLALRWEIGTKKAEG